MQANQANPSVSLGDLDLPFSASPIMDYHDLEVVQVGNQIVVGYLADDHDCQDPLEDGEGGLYTARRFSKTHGDMQAALALDSDWNPDLDLVDQHKVRLRDKWVDKAYTSIPFLVWVDDTAGAGASLSDAYYKRRARKLWDETDGEQSYDCNAMSVLDFEAYDDAREELWKELREEGLIGNKYAVLLDCYEHGGQLWSVAGAGMQCRFDTSSGAGVWVPGENVIEEVERRSKVYAFGEIEVNGKWSVSSGKLRYTAMLDKEFGGTRSDDFLDWGEAFSWLEKESRKLRLATRKVNRAAQEMLGCTRAARELANSALETYNDWLAGNCFGIVAATFTNVASKGEEPEWQFVESDECWGYIGDDYAMEDARANARGIAKGMLAQAA